MSFTGAITDVSAGIKASLAGDIEGSSAVAGIRRFYTDPPDVVNEWPALFVYHASGNWGVSTASGANGFPVIRGAHTFVASVAIPRKDLKRDIAKLQPFNDSITQALWLAGLTHRFDGTVLGVGNLLNKSQVPPIRHEIVTDDWAAVETIGIRFEIDVTVEQEVVVSGDD